MRVRRWVCLSIGLALLSPPALAQTGAYVQTDLGIAVAPALAVHGTDNDWGTKCDLLINLNGVEVTNECDAGPAASSWINRFGGGSGVQSGIAIGYDWGRVRVEGEYFHRVTSYEDRVPPDIFDDVSLDKREQEIEWAVGAVDDLRSHDVFANVYYDLRGEDSTWNPHVGFGIGAERASLDYASYWKRNDDPARIATFVDPALRARLAGTTTIGAARLSDTLFRYQVLAGVDYRIGDPLWLGLKVRWLPSRAFQSAPREWDQLRSHESHVGRGEAVVYEMSTNDNQFWGVSLSLKYYF